MQRIGYQINKGNILSETPQGSAQEKGEKEKAQMRENVLRVVLTSDARQRLTNIKMVKPDIANSIEDTIIQMASTGKLKKAVTDDEIKQYLASLNQPKKDFKIRWA